MIRQFLRNSPVSLCLAASIIVAWCVSASLLGQSPFTVQKSRLLMELGALNGEVLTTLEWWRLLTSQFLHVQFMHMLFNTICVLLIGGFIEQKYGWRRLFFIYFVGGTIGQAASVVSYPTLVSSGSSQALMALCGAAILLLPRQHPKTFVFLVVAVQAALDLYVAQQIKAGHGFGFGAGFVIGALIYFIRTEESPSEPNKPIQPTCEDARGCGQR